jgi:predicted GH43/DUF377 family glycosyl hydrolase
MSMRGTWKKQLLLRFDEVPPSGDEWEVVGAFSPGAIEVDGRVVLLVRIAERPREMRPGFMALPRFDHNHGQVVDWIEEGEIVPMDPRVVRLKSTGMVRLTFISHLRVVFAGESGEEKEFGAVFSPAEPYEAYGVEDPRITRIDDRFWITYVAVSRHGAATALASTTDFSRFERHGIIFPPENKDVVLFPEQIRDRYVALHRPNGATTFAPPQMWVAESGDLLQWGNHEPLILEHSDWESGRVGAGTPPIRIGDGWLEIYHGNCRPTQRGEVGSYQAAAMVLDPYHPARVLRRTAEPIFAPTEPFEREGFVPNVVFPTGIIKRGDVLLVYYGAGDAHTAMVEIPLRELTDCCYEVPVCQTTPA